MKTIRVILLIVAALAATSAQIFALAIGDRVQANAAASIRDNPAGNLIDEAATSDLGNIIAGPVTATYQGTPYVWWRVDWDAQSTGWSIEQRLTKLVPAPVLSSVSPASVTGVPLPGRVSLTLTGSNFVNEPSVAVTYTGGAATIASQYVTWVSATRVDITVATDVNADNWTVKVINPDGQQSGTRNFTVTTPARPDLVVEGGSISFNPSAIYVGGSFNLSFRIRNIGPGAAVATQARLRISPNTTLTSSDPGLSPLDINIPQLSTSQIYTFSGSVTVPVETPQGVYHVGVFADRDNRANQTDTSNDAGVSSSTLTIASVSGTNLPVVTIAPAAQNVTAGETANLSATVSGNGPFSYKWNVNGASWSNASQSMKFATDSHLTVSQTFTVSVTVTDAMGVPPIGCNLVVRKAMLV